MNELQQALADAMELARKQPGGLEKFLREFRLTLLEANASTRKLAQLLREEQQ